LRRAQPATTARGLLRPLASDDLPLLHAWLATGPARTWYARRDRTFEDVQARYGPLVRGERPTHAYVVLEEGAPRGYLPWYRIADHPAYASAIAAERGAAGVDMFLEASACRRGLAPQVVDLALRTLVFAQPDVAHVLVGPAPSNVRAIRALARSGFTHERTVRVEGAPEEVLMRLDRPAWASRARRQAP
jgi:aminoglycoside 6'-N-acetyltransferase